MLTTNSLPVGLPGELTVTIQEGTHRGVKQLWAPIQHDGHSYKLVVSGRISGIRCETPHAGETWTLWPDHCPNGHVIFCRPYQKLKDENGVHPLVASLQAYTKKDYRVTILCTERGANHFCEGTLESVTESGDTLTVVARDATESRGVIARGITKLVLQFSLQYSHEDRRTKALFAIHTYAGNASYRLSVQHP